MKIGPIERSILLACEPDLWTPPAIYGEPVPCRSPSMAYAVNRLIDKGLVEIAYMRFSLLDVRRLLSFARPGVEYATWAGALRPTREGVAQRLRHTQ